MRYIKIDQGAGGIAYYPVETLDDIEQAVASAEEAQLARVMVYEIGVPAELLDEKTDAEFATPSGLVLVIDPGDGNRWLLTHEQAACQKCTLGVVINGGGEIRGCPACRRFDPGGSEVVRFVAEGVAALRDLQALLWPTVPGATGDEAAAIAEASWSPDTAEEVGRVLDFLHPRHTAARKH